MGTRSRVILKRSTKPDIFLWMHWDGYWDGQGGNLCEQLRLLLETYTQQELVDMLEALHVPNLCEGEPQNFCGTFLGDFITGKRFFKNDNCTDIEYQYIIDMKNGNITGQHYSPHIYVLNFEQIRSHMRFEHIVPKNEVEGEEY